MPKIIKKCLIVCCCILKHSSKSRLNDDIYLYNICVFQVVKCIYGTFSYNHSSYSEFLWFTVYASELFVF